MSDGASMGAVDWEGGFSSTSFSTSISSPLSEERGEGDLNDDRRLATLFLGPDLAGFGVVAIVVEGLEAGRGGLNADVLRFSGGISSEAARQKVWRIVTTCDGEVTNPRMVLKRIVQYRDYVGRKHKSSIKVVYSQLLP